MDAQELTEVSKQVSIVLRESAIEEAAPFLDPKVTAKPTTSKIPP